METLYGSKSAVGHGLRREAQPDVDDVRVLRARIVLVGLDGLDLVGRSCQSGLSSLIGIPYLVVNVDEHLAVVAPVVGQGDGREVALRLGRGDEGGSMSAAPLTRGPGRRVPTRSATQVPTPGSTRQRSAKSKLCS